MLHAYVEDRRLILQDLSTHTEMITEARRQSARAIQVCATRRVLDLEAQDRAPIATTSHAMHHMLLHLFAQRSCTAGYVAQRHAGT